MLQKITPFLWFDSEAEAAARYYVSVFKRSRIVYITRYGENAPLPKGTVMTVGFELEGQSFTALNGGPAFPFTNAVSFVVNCKTQSEIDRYWKALSKGGEIIQCGWLKDRFGLAWQIVPTELPELLDARDPARSSRVLQQVMRMKKLNLATLRRAAGKAAKRPRNRRRR